jgi:hypothetical protein
MSIVLVCTAALATAIPMSMSQTEKSGSPTGGVSSAPGSSGKKKRLDYENAKPYPLPSNPREPTPPSGEAGQPTCKGLKKKSHGRK